MGQEVPTETRTHMTPAERNSVIDECLEAFRPAIDAGDHICTFDLESVLRLLKTPETKEPSILELPVVQIPICPYCGAEKPILRMACDQSVDGGTVIANLYHNVASCRKIISTKIIQMAVPRGIV